MIDVENIPPINDEELLARFIVSSNEFRNDDNTVRPKLFMPYKKVDLSVNRHLDCDEQEIWQVGIDVSKARKCNFYGRSDIRAESCCIEPLTVVSRPVLNHPVVPDNPNHADVTGFPTTKEDQKSLAMKLAASAGKRIPPPENLSELGSSNPV